MITIYGIPNCDTIKKTQDWLKDHKIDFELQKGQQGKISAGNLRKI